MSSRIFFSLLLALAGATWPAHAAVLNGDDPSRADADGPHVFYRGVGIVVKTIERGDSGLAVRTVRYDRRSQVQLTCRVPETRDEFKFALQDTLVVEPDRWTLPERVLVLSDIEGNFAGFKLMLRSARVIDEKFQWTFGKGHLVLVGDYFDRGLNVTECLWLIYKLEGEARAAGGRVHFILGNHEILNLSSNTQYVRRKYLENAALMDMPYRLWFDNNSELGRWLRTKNAVETIGDYVFCHGGISPELVESGVLFSDINRISRQYLGKSFETILSPGGRAVFDIHTGIFWFRDGVRNRISADDMTAALRYAKGKFLVVGHTNVPDIVGLYGGRLLCVDLFHEENIRQGFMKTLYLENGVPYVLTSRGEKYSVQTIAAKQ
jgi:hypothetical protein